MDNCLKSLPSVNDAIAHVIHLQALLSRGGFRLTKWVSNSGKVLLAIPKLVGSTEFRRLDLNKDEMPDQRVVSNVFDPLGFAVPFVLVAKQMLQDLCRIKLGWDDTIPPKFLSGWVKWLDDLSKLSSFSLNCSVLLFSLTPQKLHMAQFPIYVQEM